MGEPIEPRPFLPGDIIDFGSLMFRVLENSGSYGVVEPWPANQRLMRDFKWRFVGVVARKVGHVPLSSVEPTISYKLRASAGG